MDISLKVLGKTFLNAILAGIFIGLAGTVYLAVPNPVMGAFLFGFGLLTILCYSFKLFTGAIGYLVNQGKDTFRYLVILLMIWLGNLVGCFAVGSLIRMSRTFPKLQTRVAAVCADKMADNWGSLFILAVFCGILMYLAVETFRRKELDAVFRLPMVFLCVSIFILSGFEHCIANMYYFSVAGLWSLKTLWLIVIMTFGNACGGMFLPAADKIRQ